MKITTGWTRCVCLLVVCMGAAIAAGPAAASVGTISTVAGLPPSATSHGQQPSAAVAGPGGVMYVADSHSESVLKVAADGQETTFAGGGSDGPTVDGVPATRAELNNPRGVAVDSDGNVLIADYYNNAIRLVAASSCSTGCPYGLSSMTAGDIYTVAGGGSSGLGDGGPAVSAQLNGPVGVAVDSGGDLLIADSGNDRVRLVASSSCSSVCAFGLSSTTAGDIYTVAGDGTADYSGDGGAASSAELDYPDGVAVDSSGDLLIADEGNNRVRLVASSSCSSGCPFDFASMAAGDIYSIVGNGNYGGSGDGGSANVAELAYPVGVALDSRGDLLIADSGNVKVRLVAASSCSSGCPFGSASMTAGDIYTVAGDGSTGDSGDGGLATSAQLGGPRGVALDAGGDLLIADYGGDRVRLVANSNCSSGCPLGLSSMAAGDIYTVAGNGTTSINGDGGPASDAELYQPGAVTVDPGGDMLIADTADNLVRFVASSSCSSDCPFGLQTTAGDMYTVAGAGTRGASGDGGSATSADLNYPQGVVVDSSGDLLIADYGNSAVRLVASSSCSSDCPFGLSSMAAGDIYTVAGTLDSGGDTGDGGPATSAQLSYPEGVALDSAGDLLIADTSNDRVRLVAASSCSSACPFGLASMTAGDIYTIAGGGSSGLGDRGLATGAQLAGPQRVALDAAGDLLIADSGDSRVRLVAASSCSSGCPFGLSAMTEGHIYTVAGGGSGGLGDSGPATSAELHNPVGVAVDVGGDLLVADYGSQRVRLVAGSSCSSGCPFGLASMTVGDIYTVAGDGIQGFSGDDGPAGSAELSDPSDVTVGSGGDLLIADTANDRIRRVTGGPVSPSAILSVSLTGSGEGTVAGGLIDCPGTCATRISNGSTATLTASPSAGSVFAGWSGGGCSGTGSCTVTVSAAESVSANFTIATSTSVACSPSSVSTGAATHCTATVTTASAGAPAGTVSFRATPNTGRFGTSGKCTLLAGGSGSASCVVAFTPTAAGSYTVTASYGGSSGDQASSGQSAALTAKAPGRASIAHISVSGTTASIAARCTGSTSCKLKLTMSVIEKLVHGKVIAVTASAKSTTKTVVVSSKAITIAAGKSETIKLSLNSAGKRLLANHNPLKAKLTITAAGKTITSRTISFKAKRHHRK